MEELKTIFDRHYVANPVNYPHQSVPYGWLKNPHLEITAYGDFSDKLKELFNYHLFRTLYAEKLKPDIMGFVKKKPQSKPAFITVEVKAGSITIRNVLQAKLYQHIFKAKFSFVISPKGISREKLSVILENNRYLRGDVIIAKYIPERHDFRIPKPLGKHIPKFLSDYIK